MVAVVGLKVPLGVLVDVKADLALAQLLEDVVEIAVARGRGHQQVEGDVGHDRVAGFLVDMLGELVEDAAQLLYVRLGAPLGGEAGGLGLEADAQLQDRHEVEHREDVLGVDAQVLFALGVQQESADAVPGLDQAGRLQPRDRLADDGAADAEGLHQLGFGGELFTDVEFAVADALGQRGNDVLGQVARAAFGDGGVCRSHGLFFSGGLVHSSYCILSFKIRRMTT